MTCQSPWDPYSHQFATEELQAANRSVPHQHKPRSLSTVSRVMSSVSRALADVDSLANALEETVRISYESFISSTRSVNKRGAVNAERLADLWNIGIETAKKTLEHTTQRGNRLFTNSKMTKRLKSTVDQLKFRQLSCIMYSDTLFSKIPSVNQNLCMQLYVTPFHWSAAYAMKSKSEAPDTYHALTHQYGVPRLTHLRTTRLKMEYESSSECTRPLPSHRLGSLHDGTSQDPQSHCSRIVYAH